MADEFTSSRGLSVSQGGSGERLVVLLHGLGAHRAVWERMLAIADQYWPGRWMAPDLRGHGRSVKSGPYGYGIHAADIADLIADEADVTLMGHSFGGVIAALTGSGLFGPKVRDVAAFGVKIVWTAEETAKAQELALKPARTFARREEAIERALKLAGLFGLVEANSETAAAGVIGTEGQWQGAMDPRIYGAVGPSVECCCGCPHRRCASPPAPTIPWSRSRRCARSIPPRACSTAPRTTRIGKRRRRCGTSSTI